MANAIEASLKEIYLTIPKEILDLAFLPYQRRIALDKCIIDDVITSKVLYDCNIVAGKKCTIVLKPEWCIESELPSSYSIYAGNAYCIYRIPPEARENRPIADCISVDYPGYLYGYGNGVGTIPNMAMAGVGNSMGDVACTMIGAMNNSGVVTPTPIRLNGHEVKLTPITFSLAQNVDWILECRLAYDKEMTNLNTRAIRPFVALCVAAVKAYIYTKLIVQIDNQYLSGGQELGVVKEIVQSYSGALDDYQEKLRKFHGGAVCMDPELAYKLAWNFF